MDVTSSPSTNLPTWLESLLTEKFFEACIVHEDAKKNEKNIFCIDCCGTICPHCIYLHNSHRLLQIRKYVYHNVIRVEDAEKLMDCAYVQAYVANKAKCVFLNPRPQTKPCRNSSSICISCDRSLQYPYVFCSISCKINQILRDKEMMSKYLHECKVLTLPEPGSEDGFMTPESVHEPVLLFGSTEIVRKKRSSKYEVPTAELMTETTVNRRKSMPCRSPIN
uniref:protein RGF1 INDUCIBLE TRANSCRIPTION FACTOR 1 n=1 Tax=Erigeron canadensis TaxID=72917 RepID=UPI001CB8A862|nr:protein RGF1 INDUCIBLE TRANSCRIPTION FACTOR 1 [Erigeron canadensis]